MEIRLSSAKLNRLGDWFNRINYKLVWVFSILFSIATIVYCYLNDYIVRYGDSESHLNIAKRVVDSITPGFAQLGGIWLPLPHLFMVPFIWSDFMWRSGLAGAIVSGIAYVISAVFIYKTTDLLLKNRTASFIAAFVFMLNPNVLYMQATPMTELVLIAFFTLSTYYFIKFLMNQNQLSSILLAAFFGFCSVLTRYDGWFLIGLEAGSILLYYIPWKNIPWRFRDIKNFIQSEDGIKAQGYIVIFSTLAFFGIILWLLWDFLILGDPFYFTTSQFSAASQQQIWLENDRLPSYGNPLMAFIYYFVTAMSNAGVLVYLAAVVGLIYYLANRENKSRWFVALLLGAPFIFNVLTLFMGQSVIFIPHLTPLNWEHSLFNVRYGLMTIPLVAFAFGYLFYINRAFGKLVLVGLCVVQFGMYYVGYSPIISYQDGRTGLSAASRPEAERWINSNYDFGLVLMDDYARTVSVVRSGIPMEQMIYIGNKPYWQESLVTPDKHVQWIVMQENDAVWDSLWEIPARRARLEKYYDKMFQSTSGANIAIYRKKRAAPTDDGDIKVAQTFWNHQCIDTMKYSRDRAREHLHSPLAADQFIEREVALVAGTGANCISLGTPYDEEFVPVLTKWVNEAREKDLKIWFRGNMSGWEGWFEYPKYGNVQQHHDGVLNIITKHPELFQEGDIFTPAPEPENGIIGDPRNSTENKNRFLEFLPKSYANCVNAFNDIKVDVTCGYFSVNGDVAREIFTKDLLVDIGDVVVIDHYVRTPEQLIEDVKSLNKKLDTLVMLGEFGAPIPDIHGDMTEEQQAAFITQALEKLYEEQDILLGFNYWVLRDGSTQLVDGEADTRAAYDSLKEYFMPAQVRGSVVDVLGNPVAGLKVKIDKYRAETVTNDLGAYSLVVPARDASIELTTGDYSGEKSFDLKLVSGQEVRQDFAVDPIRKGLWYKIRLWWKHVRE
jgi:hypothetical protein